MSSPIILVVEPARTSTPDTLSRHGLEVVCSCNYAEPRLPHSGSAPDLGVISVPPGQEGAALELVRRMRALGRGVPVVLTVAQSSEQFAVRALNAGVGRYLREPVSGETIVAACEELLAPCKGPAAEADGDCGLLGGEQMIGDSPPMRDLRGLIKKLDPWSSNVLITGETGTGKELVAELIHKNSARRHKPFVCLNSTAIPESLLESELFGYERGAFTGAQAAYPGKLAMANSGTVFFDEIGDISPHVQAKLLRVLDGKQVYRLGSNRAVPLDLRILAATNQDIERAVEAGRFRQDLYYRLNVVRVRLPLLRERVEDIPKLLTFYVKEMNSAFGTRVEGFTRDALDVLLAHTWPGNIRELRNVVEAVFINLQGRTIDTVHLPEHVKRHLSEMAGASGDERERLLRALVATDWNKTQAAHRLHWSRMTLYRKMSRYHIVRGERREPARIVCKSGTKREAE